MWNVKLNPTIFYILFIQTKINEQTKQNKTVVKIHESQFNAPHASFILIMLFFSLLEDDNAEVSKILTSGN